MQRTRACDAAHMKASPGIRRRRAPGRYVKRPIIALAARALSWQNTLANPIFVSDKYAEERCRDRITG
jgi:hypothetical protein